MPRYEIQLPLKFNDGSPVPEELFVQVRDELITRFGGFHVLSPGSPVEGYWKSGGVVYRDDMLIYRVTTQQSENQFFQGYRKALVARFKQQDIRIEVEPAVYPL